MALKLRRASERGQADHGWLKARFSFSFAEYYNPDNIRFGLLRVLNDDHIQAGGGFGTHGHEDMEIITIPLEGQIEHKDSMGNGEVLSAGEVQIMSAGSGIRHSEFNPSKTNDTRLFQIWVFPKSKGITPRYGQRKFDRSERQNQWQTLVAPNGSIEKDATGPLSVHQDTWFSRADLSQGSTIEYKTHNPKHGIYLMVIEGSVKVQGETLKRRDTLEITKQEDLNIFAKTAAQLLLIEVPMTQK